MQIRKREARDKVRKPDNRINVTSFSSILYCSCSGVLPNRGTFALPLTQPILFFHSLDTCGAKAEPWHCCYFLEICASQYPFYNIECPCFKGSTLQTVKLFGRTRVVEAQFQIEAPDPYPQTNRGHT